MALLTLYARAASPAFVAPAPGGDTFRNPSGNTEILIINNGAEKELTVTAVGRCKHGFLDDHVETIPAGSFHRAGPFKAGRFNSSTGIVAFSLDDQTDVTVASQLQEDE